MKYYTYCHIRNDTGQIFYIGKGSGKRVNSKQHRNIWWRNVANKAGYSSEILAYWENESEAFEHEKFLISVIPNLVNFTNGGEGASGYKHTLEQNEIKSKKMREYHKNNPEAAKLWSVNKKAIHTKTSEWKSAQSERSKKLHSDPEYQRKFSIAQRKVRARVLNPLTVD